MSCKTSVQHQWASKCHAGWTLSPVPSAIFRGWVRPWPTGCHFVRAPQGWQMGALAPPCWLPFHCDGCRNERSTGSLDFICSPLFTCSYWFSGDGQWDTACACVRVYVCGCIRVTESNVGWILLGFNWWIVPKEQWQTTRYFCLPPYNSHKIKKSFMWQIQCCHCCRDVIIGIQTILLTLYPCRLPHEKYCFFHFSRVSILKILWHAQTSYTGFYSILPIFHGSTALVIELEVPKNTVKIYFHNSPIKVLIVFLTLS